MDILSQQNAENLQHIKAKTVVSLPKPFEYSTNGGVNEAGVGLSVRQTSPVSTNTVSTTYALKGVRKKTANLYNPVCVTDISVAQTSNSDAGMLSLHLNPTLSAPLTWANVANSFIQEGTASAGQTLTSQGRIICSFPVTTAVGQSLLLQNYLKWIGATLAGTSHELILGYTPLTATQQVAGIINVLEY